MNNVAKLKFYQRRRLNSWKNYQMIENSEIKFMYTLARFKNIGINAIRKRCGRLKCTLESEDKHIIVTSFGGGKFEDLVK